MPALIDTGAGRTVLTPEAVGKLQLPLVDHTTLCRLGGKDKVGVHVASIQFPGDRLGTIEIIEVACAELPEQPIQCLLGRDILSHWLFTYNGKTGEWIIEEEDLAVWVEPPEGIY
jgi:predicted aspartyl protease